MGLNEEVEIHFHSSKNRDCGNGLLEGYSRIGTDNSMDIHRSKVGESENNAPPPYPLGWMRLS